LTIGNIKTVDFTSKDYDSPHLVQVGAMRIEGNNASLAQHWGSQPEFNE
jgi:hypothetical protein